MAKVKPVLLTKARCEELCDEAFRQYNESIMLESNHNAIYLQSSDNIRLDIYLRCLEKDCDIDKNKVDAHSREYIGKLIISFLNNEYNRRNMKCQFQKTIKTLLV